MHIKSVLRERLLSGFLRKEVRDFATAACETMHRNRIIVGKE